MKHAAVATGNNGDAAGVGVIMQHYGAVSCPSPGPSLHLSVSSSLRRR